MILVAELKHLSSDFSGPISSFDWNPEDLVKIATSSIDDTVTIWDIDKASVNT